MRPKALRADLAAYQRERRQRLKEGIKTTQRRRVTSKDLIKIHSGDRADAVARWAARCLKVPVGIKANKPFTIAKWQSKFLSEALQPGVVEAGLCVARKNGKSGLIAALLLAYLVGPLNNKNWRCIVVSLTGHLANELRKQISEIAVASALDELIAVRSTPAPGKVVGLNNSEVSILAADKATGHAVGSDLVIIDEGGLLSEKDRDLWNACLTSISGRNGRLICISIRGDSPMLSELSNRKDQSGVVWHEYAADSGCDYMNKKQWHAANPGLRSKIKSIEYMKHTAMRAKQSPADAPTFLAYDLNLPQSPTRETIVGVNEYSQCVVGFNELPDRAGPVFVGIDLGGSSSMTAAVFYWPDTARLECIGAFGNKPGLKQRGQSDGVGGLYEQMQAKNELKIYEGYATPVKHFIKDVALMLEGQLVAGVACDRYRKSEFLDALYGARVPWANMIEFRGQGSSMVFTADGAYDVRSFQVAVLERRIKVCVSLLLEHSIANSSISRDAAGNCKLDRATPRGRIDTLQASVLALGLGARYRERNAGGGAKFKLHIIQ